VRKIGVIGLGLLGTALAQRFLIARNRVLGYDLSAERRAALESAGGRAANSALEVVEQCDTILLSLPDAAVVSSVIDAIVPALRPGQLIIDTTTGEPLETERLGARLATRGVDFLDATIAGSSVQVYEGQVIVMVGGDEEILQASRELFRCFAREVFHLGRWGSGSRMKLVVNLVLGLNRAVLAEGLTFARALGVDQQQALAILKASPAFSTVMDTKGEKMLTCDFSTQARLSQHLKDVRLILAAGARTGAELPLSSVHRELLELAETLGCGELDNSAILRAFEAKSSRSTADDVKPASP